MPSTERGTIEEGDAAPMMCAYTDRRQGGAGSCFDPATHSYRSKERPDKEDFACARHARWLLDSGLVDEDSMKKLKP